MSLALVQLRRRRRIARTAAGWAESANVERIDMEHDYLLGETMDTTRVTNQDERYGDSLATKDSSQISQVVSFQLANEYYGINIQNVQEIILVGTITSIPEVPTYVEGLINLRGKVLPVIDLRRRFGLSSKEFGEKTRIIVTNTSHRTIGLVVDEVHEVLRLDDNQIEPLPDGLTNVDAAYITGVVKLEDRILILLDTEVVLSDETQASLAQAEAARSGTSIPDASTASAFTAIDA